MKNLLGLGLCLVLLHGSLKSQSAIVDYSFAATQPDNLVEKVLLQPDGKILVGGFFTDYAGSGKNYLVRLNTDGTVDTTFNVSGTGPTNGVADIGLMPDGRIVIAGNFVQYNSTPCSFVIRLHADGSVDNTFMAQANVINNAVWALELQGDDKIVIAGDFFTCFSTSQPHITRLNYDGSLDTSFHVGTGFNNTVYDLLILPDQRILCGGRFVIYQGQPTLGISLLLPDGTQDTSMHVSNAFSGTGTAVVYSLTRQPDGKIIVSGAFSYHNSQQITGIARLNLDGTRDLSFTPPLYPYAIVKISALQADNKILAGGEFTTSMFNPNITGSHKLIRLHPNGTLDTSFHVGTAFQNQNDFINDIAVQPDTKIIVAGNFTYFDSETSYHHIIRLYESVPLGVEEQEQGALSVFPNPSSSGFNITNPAGDGSEVEVVMYNMQGELVYSLRIASPRGETIRLEPALPAGMYFIRATSNGRVFGRSVVLTD